MCLIVLPVMKTILPTWLEWPLRGNFFSYNRSSVQIVFPSSKNQLSPCWKHYWNPCVTVCIMYMIQNHGTFIFKNTFGLHSRNNYLKIAYVQNECLKEDGTVPDVVIPFLQASWSCLTWGGSSSWATLCCSTCLSQGWYLHWKQCVGLWSW